MWVLVGAWASGSSFSRSVRADGDAGRACWCARTRWKSGPVKRRERGARCSGERVREAEVISREAGESWLRASDHVVAGELGWVAGGIAGTAPTGRTIYGEIIHGTIPEDIPLDDEVCISCLWAAEVGAAWRGGWASDLKRIRSFGATWVIEEVVENVDVSVRDVLFFCARRTPATSCTICVARCTIAIAATSALVGLEEVITTTNANERVVGHQDVVAAIDAHARHLRVANDVVHEDDPIGFVVQIGRFHEFESRALSGNEAAYATVEDLVAFDTNVCRSSLGVHTPILGIRHLIAHDVPALNRHEVDRVVFGAANLAILDVDVLRLVDFDRLVSDTIAAAQDHIPHQDVGTAFTVEGVSCWLWNDVEVYQVQVAYIEDVHVTAENCGAFSVSALEDDRELRRALFVFPVVRNRSLWIGTTHQLNSIAGP